MKNEAAFWIALSELKNWGYAKINSLIIQFSHDNKLGIEEFFNLSKDQWSSEYTLNDKQVSDLYEAKTRLPGYAFLAEDMINQGYEFIPILSAHYSTNLKKYLKATYAPPLLTIKGNRELLMKQSAAIIGSRDASEISLKFTETIARKACRENKVVVSGYARGVDRQALDSALSAGGQSIIVLPQGILTFSSGFQQYYKQITNGDVLVLSTYFPKSQWTSELAMARNTIIYGLADEIYVAESSEKGGSWSGVVNGLSKGRTVFVRQPEEGEKNANSLLIQKGATAINLLGEPLNNSNYLSKPVEFQADAVMEETRIPESPEGLIRNVLKKDSLTLPGIMSHIGPEWPEVFIKNALKSMNDIEIIKLKGENQYRLKGSGTEQGKLF
jgi:predicted Rossmann fold nucleotide-binding protein DprA/Smf involved in DNA uptake